MRNSGPRSWPSLPSPRRRQRHAVVQITEWMYNPVAATNGEYVEITNRGAAPVDLTGWSFDDSSNVPGGFSLSALGV